MVDYAYEKIPMIKLYRDVHRVGLKDAKQAVNKLIGRATNANELEELVRSGNETTSASVHVIADAFNISYGMVRDLERQGHVAKQFDHMRGGIYLSFDGLARIGAVTKRRLSDHECAEASREILREYRIKSFQHFTDMLAYLEAGNWADKGLETYRQQMIRLVKQWRAE